MAMMMNGGGERGIIRRTLSVGFSFALLACGSAPTADPAAEGPTSAVGAPCPVLSPDQPKASPGPYDHTLYRRMSADGHSFGASSPPMVEHASAPDAVTGPDGAPWVYFVNGNPGQHAIFIARQPAGSEAWEVFDCARFDGSIDATAVDPDVVRLADGRFRLFYNPLLPANPTAPNPIVSAVSIDGIQFQREGSVVETPGALNPSAVRLNDGSWLMALATEDKTYLARSADGAAFTLIQEHPAGIPELAYDPGLDEVRFYNAERRGLTLLTSTDGGSTWTDWGVVDTGIQDPSLHRTADGRWVLYYRVGTAAP